MEYDELSEVKQLRSLLSQAQEKLEYRTFLLAQVVPHLESWSHENWERNDGSSPSYICEEVLQKYGELLTRFKDEYGKETQQYKDSKF